MKEFNTVFTWGIRKLPDLFSIKSVLILSIGLLGGFKLGSHADSEPEIVSLNHVAIAVDNYEETIEFYSETLGFPIAFEFGESDGFSMTYLQINKNTFIEVIPSSDELPKGFVHIGLEVTHADSLMSRLNESGVRTWNARKSPRTQTTIGMVKAPDGTYIELLEAGPGSLHREVMDNWKE